MGILWNISSCMPSLECHRVRTQPGYYLMSSCHYIWTCFCESRGYSISGHGPDLIHIHGGPPSLVWVDGVHGSEIEPLKEFPHPNTHWTTSAYKSHSGEALCTHKFRFSVHKTKAVKEVSTSHLAVDMARWTGAMRMNKDLKPHWSFLSSNLIGCWQWKLT